MTVMCEPLTTEELGTTVARLAEEYGIDRVLRYDRRFCEYDCLCGFCIRPSDGCGVFQLSGFSRKLEEALGPVEVVCKGSARHSELLDGSVPMELIYEKRKTPASPDHIRTRWPEPPGVFQ